jgi:hypothetical protein
MPNLEIIKQHTFNNFTLTQAESQLDKMKPND